MFHCNTGEHIHLLWTWPKGFKRTKLKQEKLLSSSETGHYKRIHFRNSQCTEYLKNLLRVWIYHRCKGGCGPTTAAGRTVGCDDITYLFTYPSCQGGSSHRKASKINSNHLKLGYFLHLK